MSRSPNRHNKIFIKVEPLAPRHHRAHPQGRAERHRRTRRRIVKTPPRPRLGLGHVEDSRGPSTRRATCSARRPRESSSCKSRWTRCARASRTSCRTAPSPTSSAGGSRSRSPTTCRTRTRPTAPTPSSCRRRAVPSWARCSRRTRPSWSPSWASRSRGPADQIGAITGVISGKRGKLINIEQREVLTIVEGEIPAAETFDLSEMMRGATAGRAVWNTYFKLWQSVPTNMLPPLVAADQEAQGPPAGSPEGLRVHRQRVGQGTRPTNL